MPQDDIKEESEEDDHHCHQGLEAEANTDKSKSKMSLFLTRFNNEEDHVPSSNDFVVY